MTERQREQIVQHGRNLLTIFPRARERDPVKLCKKLRRLEAQASKAAVDLCNVPNYQDQADVIFDSVLVQTNKLLGNVREYQPKTGAKCGCKRGQQRDNCPNCEGTGMVIDFAAIRSKLPELVPVFVNRDPRGYALKINDEWLAKQRGDHRTVHMAVIHKDMGGYGIIAPDIDAEGN